MKAPATPSDPPQRPSSRPDCYRPDCSRPLSPTSQSRPRHTALSLYKALFSPVLHTLSPTQCLYLPTCSEYAYVAWSRFGPARGSWLALRRLLRCHPLAKGGFDPVPPSSPDRTVYHERGSR